MVSEQRLRELHAARWDNVLTWQQWEEIYKPIPNPSDTSGDTISFDTEGKDLEEVSKYPENQIWTGKDGGGIYTEIISGMHLTDRLEYYITQVPWDRDLCVTNNPDPD